MAEKLLPIVFATDHNFVMPTCVTIHSLLKTKNNGVEYDINVIINKDVTLEDRNILISQVEKDSPGSTINFVEIGDAFKEGFEIRDISTACYNRLMIPWLLPLYDKVIYSDVDIIFKNDISEIYDLDLENNLLAGYNGEVWKRGLIKKYIKKIGADPEEYVNSGFIVINSKLNRELGLKARYLEHSQRKYLYQDQDILNIICRGKIIKIPQIYNVKPTDVYKYSRKELKVIHYIGLKPWDHFTYSWCDWWDVYNDTQVFDPERNLKVSRKILNWKTGIKTNRKILRQKIKFIKDYLRY